MPIPVNAIPSIVAVQGVTRDVAFQPGTVVAARVIEVSANNQARISIAGQAIDVKTQVPLQAGQSLRLAVSQTADGIRLAVVPQQATTTSSDLSATLLTALAASKAQLTTPEAVAVSQAALGAVTKQASLSALFANLGAATSLESLPPKLQQAIAQVLAQRPALDAKLTGGEVKTAFQNSGLFMEASLAQGAPAAGAIPDMKAALIVLRQALTAALGGEAGKAVTSSPANQQAAPAQPQATALPVATTAQVAAAAATLVPAMLQKSTAKGEATPQSGATADEGAEVDARIQLAAAAATAKGASGATTTNAAPQPNGKHAEIIAQLLSDDGALAELLPTGKGQPNAATYAEALPLRGLVPPPPLRGALPTAQPIASPTIAPNAPMDDAVQHLLTDTDAAIARQTLHQVASLPERVDMAAPRSDQAAQQRWSFEVPFAMPHGTAVAQFEIARDGGQGSEAEAAKQVWRARYSLDVEPAGPIHALVSLAGEKTSVRMWAERAATAQQLQAGTADLSQALIRANLQPGDIVVRNGAPQQAVPASAGHFLDMAL